MMMSGEGKINGAVNFPSRLRGVSPSPNLDMIGVAVSFKALCDSVPDLKQARTSVLQLLLIRQTLVGLVQLLQGLLHRPHAFLALCNDINGAEFVAPTAVGFQRFHLKRNRKGRNSQC